MTGPPDGAAMQEKAKRIRSTDGKASAGLTSTRLLVDIQLYSFSALVGTRAGRRAHILSTSLTNSSTSQRSRHRFIEGAGCKGVPATAFRISEIRKLRAWRLPTTAALALLEHQRDQDRASQRRLRCSEREPLSKRDRGTPQQLVLGCCSSRDRSNKVAVGGDEVVAANMLGKRR